MASKPIDIQHNYVVIEVPEAPQSAYVGLFASALGLAQIFSDGRTGVLLSTLDRRSDVRAAESTDESVVTETGIRAAIDSAVSGVTGYWKRVGTVLSPLTTGNTINVSSTGAIQAIYGISNGAINSVGVRGSSDLGFGVYGTSTSSHGVVGVSTSANGGYFSSTSGTGVVGSSTSGKGGAFSSYSNIPLEVSVLSTDTSLLYNMINIMRNTSGTAANGIGAIINFNIEDATGGSSPSVQLAAELTNLSPVSSSFSIKLRNAGGSASEVMRLSGAGVLNVLSGFSVGGTGAVADGTYTVGLGVTTNGVITTKGGIITSIIQAT